MFDAMSEAFADAQFYAPLGTMADPGRRFAPARVPDGWRGADRDVWTAWSAPGVRRAEQGWKVHVSARLERAQEVLDLVADRCFAEGVPFKHLSAHFFYLALHHKHAARPQAGKFCAAYPPDTEAAGRLLAALAEDLRGEEGGYVLTDRRYRDSRTVHYRYGAFGPRSRLLADGTAQPLVRDGHGHEVPDVRLPRFALPDGVTDPFVTEEPAPHRGAIRIRGYEVLTVLRPSNAGGAYRARDTRTGRLVLVKEARPHNGYTWDGAAAQERLRREYETLTAVHAAAPGACPEPLDHFTEWEHDFLVMELVEGLPLVKWINRSSPVLLAGRPAEDFDRYHAACRRLLGSLDEALGRLHALGLRFGDVNPGNVIVTPAGDARLVDFETVTPVSAAPARMGTPGFVPPRALAAAHPDPLLSDRYGAAAVALALLAPFPNAPQLTPANFALLRRDLAAVSPVPEDLWRRATAFHRPGADEAAGLPGPEEVEADPLGCLARLARRTATGLLDLAAPERPDWLFPPSPSAFGTNTVCLAYGTAGVVHALHRAGLPVPGEVGERLRRDALASADALPPGLAVGSAGVARVLAEAGHLDEAVGLLRTADGHPLTRTTSTLAGGRAGVGLAWLALHRRTGDPCHLERAAAAGDAILRTPDLGPTLGADDARGLFHGRSGPALFLHRLADRTGEQRYRRAGLALLHEELDRAVELSDGSLSFADNGVRRRVMPYLATGSAGIATVLLRYAAGPAADERCATALPRVVADTRKVSAAQPGLHDGFAGLVHLAAEHADSTRDGADRDHAVRLATGLLKYAVPHGDGVRWLGTGSLRFSADLASGSAGILLALCRALHGPGDDRFTLDPLNQPQREGSWR
ncbi:class III lanthionine synthetase LanKC [Kitasatospora sp. NPDC001664]